MPVPAPPVPVQVPVQVRVPQPVPAMPGAQPLAVEPLAPAFPYPTSPPNNQWQFYPVVKEQAERIMRAYKQRKPTSVNLHIAGTIGQTAIKDIIPRLTPTASSNVINEVNQLLSGVGVKHRTPVEIQTQINQGLMRKDVKPEKNIRKIKRLVQKLTTKLVQGRIQSLHNGKG